MESVHMCHGHLFSPSKIWAKKCALHTANMVCALRQVAPPLRARSSLCQMEMKKLTSPVAAGSQSDNGCESTL